MKYPIIVALDLEGVLIPEIWIAFAEKTGIPQFRLTTRDISDYDELMGIRLRLLRENNLKLTDIQEVISSMQPLPGALEFLNKLRSDYQVIILSDTFYQFAGPFMEKLGMPMLFCNELIIADDGSVESYRIRIQDGKRHAVLSLRNLNFFVVAAGDSYNDTTMLKNADAGILFRPPSNVIEEFPMFPVAEEYAKLRELIDSAVS